MQKINLMKKSLIIIMSLVVMASQACTSQGTTPSNASTTQQQPASVTNINQNQFTSLTQDKKVQVIDVRTPEEIAEGYITGTQLFIDFNGSDFEKKIKALDPNTTYIIYCRSGGRSSKAADYMVNKGFKKVYNLTGGITQWTGSVSK